MPDTKMALAYAAEKTIAPLAAQVRKLTRQLDTLRQREISEAEAFTKAREDVVRWKSLAGGYLEDGPGGFARFQTGLKRAMAKEETSKESIQIFGHELVPGKARELEAARQKLANEFSALYATSKTACEARMAELLDAVIAERDGFVAAFEELRKTYGGSYSGPAPRVHHGRIDGVAKCGMGKPLALEFKAAPAAPATSPAAAANACPGRAESPPTPAREESVKGDTPCAALLAPEHEADAPDLLGAAALRARVLRRSTGDAGDAAPMPLEPIPESAPADLDADALPLDVDAPDEDPDPPDLDEAAAAEADAEAPPEVGEKENPKIVAESS
jgi:hypothetical protein